MIIQWAQVFLLEFMTIGSVDECEVLLVLIDSAKCFC